MKTVTLTVDFVVELNDDVDPDAVTFEIPIEQMVPMEVEESGTSRVGRVISYGTQQYFGEDPTGISNEAIEPQSHIGEGQR